MTLDPITTVVIDKVASIATERVIRRLLPQKEQLGEELAAIRNEQERQSLTPLHTAVLHLERNEYDDARRQLVTSLGNAEDGALVHLLLSGVYRRLGRLDQAAIDLWHGVLLNPYLLTDSEWSDLAPAMREGSVNSLPAASTTTPLNQKIRGAILLPPLPPSHESAWMYPLHSVRFQSGARPVLQSDPSGWMHEMRLKLAGWGGHAFVYALALAAWPDLSRAWVVFWWVGRTEGVHTVSPMDSVVWAVDASTGAYLWQHRMSPHDRLVLVTPKRVVIEETKPSRLFRLLDIATGMPTSSMRPATFTKTFAPGWPDIQWKRGYQRSHWQFSGSLFELWNAAKQAREAALSAHVSDPFGADRYEADLKSIVSADSYGSQNSPILRTHTIVGHFPQEMMPVLDTDTM